MRQGLILTALLVGILLPAGHGGAAKPPGAEILRVRGADIVDGSVRVSA